MAFLIYLLNLDLFLFLSQALFIWSNVQIYLICLVREQEEFKDTKGVIRICKSKKNRQHNEWKKEQKDKQLSTKHYTENKDRATQTLLKGGGELRIGSCVSGTPSFVGQSDSYVSDLRQWEVPSSVLGSSISITENSNRGNSSDSVDKSTPGFYSRLFLVPKKTGGMRPVIDLSILNSYLSVPHFKMETNRSIRACILPGMLTTKLDLSDAYFHIPISLASRKFLRFVWNKVYQFLAVPFGLVVAPQVFTRVFQTVIAHLHTLLVQAHSYLDDSLLKEFDSEILSCHTCLFIRLFLDLGFLISWKKSQILPSQDFLF